MYDDDVKGWLPMKGNWQVALFLAEEAATHYKGLTIAGNEWIKTLTDEVLDHFDKKMLWAHPGENGDMEYDT